MQLLQDRNLRLLMGIELASWHWMTQTFSLIFAAGLSIQQRLYPAKDNVNGCQQCSHPLLHTLGLFGRAQSLQYQHRTHLRDLIAVREWDLDPVQEDCPAALDCN